MGIYHPDQSAVADSENAQLVQPSHWNKDHAFEIPAVSMISVATTSIPTATWTSLALAGELFDTDGLHSISVQTSRATIQHTGKYFVIGQADFSLHATGSRLLRLFMNNATLIGTSPQVAGSGSIYVGNTVIAARVLSAGDYVELQAFQDSGTTLTNHAAFPSALTLIYVGD